MISHRLCHVKWFKSACRNKFLFKCPYKFICKYYMVGWNLSWKGFIVSAVTNMWYAIKMGVFLSISVLPGDSVCWNSLMYYKRAIQSSIMMLEYVLVVEKKYHHQSIINYYFQNQTPQFLISSSRSLPTCRRLVKRIRRNRDQMLWVTYQHPPGVEYVTKLGNISGLRLCPSCFEDLGLMGVYRRAPGAWYWTSPSFYIDSFQIMNRYCLHHLLT